MKLYHFTSPNALKAIHRHGLTIGDVPTSLSIDSKGLIAVWLTDALIPEGHGLNSSIDKRRCRLEVLVDPTDPKLKRWSDWAPEHVSFDCALSLVRSDGHAWRSWFLYFGWISPDRIVSVTDRETGKVMANWADSFPTIDHVKAVPFWNRDRWHKGMLKQHKRAFEQIQSERGRAP